MTIFMAVTPNTYRQDSDLARSLPGEPSRVSSLDDALGLQNLRQAFVQTIEYLPGTGPIVVQLATDRIGDVLESGRKHSRRRQARDTHTLEGIPMAGRHRKHKIRPLQQLKAGRRTLVRDKIGAKLGGDLHGLAARLLPYPRSQPGGLHEKPWPRQTRGRAAEPLHQQLRAQRLR